MYRLSNHNYDINGYTRVNMPPYMMSTHNDAH